MGDIGGSTGNIHTTLDAWVTSTATTDDSTPVGLGALKHLVGLLYDQLIRVGHASTYPWNGSLAQANGCATANIGQVKNLFSFDSQAYHAGRGHSGLWNTPEHQ